MGYRPRTGTVFFTRNGKKLDDVAHGLKSQNLFPTVGANGPCTVHVNFGQSGFVFIEANVKKWGLAPTTGSLAPPPPYGSEQGSILLEAGRETAAATHSNLVTEQRHGRTRSGNIRAGQQPTSPGPVRSPTDISLAHLVHINSREDAGEGSTAQCAGLGISDHSQPPPEYTSPRGSDAGSRRGSGVDGSDDERRPMIRRKTTPPPIPSYSDAVAGDRARARSQSYQSVAQGRSRSRSRSA